MVSHRTTSALALFVATLGTCSFASAQVGAGAAWSTAGGPPIAQTVGPGPVAYAPAATMPYQTSTDTEAGVLYVTAAAYGVGTGIWLDGETGISDPGLRFVAPVLLGAAAPVGVYVLDHPKMPRGVPAAISAGMLIGAGEGVGIWATQYTHANEDDQWGFRGLSRGVFLGSTVGGLAGAAAGFLQEPSPKTSLLLGSGALWGGTIGGMLGYGASAAGQGYGVSNDGGAVGGMIGYNLGLVAAGAASTVFVPTYKQLAAMWIGGGVGFAATLPVYLFYAGSSDDHPAKRGLIVQSAGTAAGIAVGALLTLDDHDDIASADPYGNGAVPIARITGLGALPVPGGAGAQLMGVLF